MNMAIKWTCRGIELTNQTRGRQTEIDLTRGLSLISVAAHDTMNRSPSLALTATLVLVALLAFTVSAVETQSNPKHCVAHFDPNTDYFPYKITIEYAEAFSVEYHSNYKIVRNKRSNEVNVLVMCGTPAPLSIPQDANILYIPFTSVSVTDTTTLNFFELQGLRSVVKFMDTALVISPCVQKLAEQGQIVPYSTNATTRAQQMNETDAIFGSFDDDTSNGKFITQSASADPGPLQRAEWIEYISLFFNTEDVAERRFNEIRDRYQCHRNNSQRLAPETRLRVAWTSYSAPAEWNNFQQSWRVSNAEYLHEYVTDAGASLITLGDANVFTSLAAVQDVLLDAQVVVDETFDAVTLSLFKTNFGIDANNEGGFTFMQNQQVWRIDRLQNAAGGLDWFESALPEADLVLENLISIVLPDYQPGYKRIWFRNIAQGEEIQVVTSADCTDPNSISNPRGDKCTIMYSHAPRIGGLLMTAVAVALLI